jgi:hypothetical protein
MPINPPFIPPKFIDQPQKGRWTHAIQGGNAPVEDGPGTFQNPSNTGPVVVYNGQTQTAAITAVKPKPPTQILPGKADPSHSRIQSP